jgi:DNA-binding ferritin-like protein
MSCEKKLQNLIYDNFMVGYKAHKYHVNVSGPDFYQYHKLLGKVYEKLQDWDDILCEHIVQMGYKVDQSIKKAVSETLIKDGTAKTGVEMIKDLCDDLMTLKDNANYLYEATSKDQEYAIESSIGTYLEDISKLHWMLKATTK